METGQNPLPVVTTRTGGGEEATLSSRITPKYSSTNRTGDVSRWTGTSGTDGEHGTPLHMLERPFPDQDLLLGAGWHRYDVDRHVGKPPYMGNTNDIRTAYYRQGEYGKH